MEVQRHSFTNKFSVVLVPNKALPIVDVQGWFPAGSVLRPANRWVGELTPGLLTKGTATHTRIEFEDALDEYALNFHAGFSALSPLYMEWGGEALAGYEENLIELAHEGLRFPTFPEEELSILRDRREAELKKSASDPLTQARSAGSRMLYENAHILYVEPEGERLEKLQAVTVQGISQFHAFHYLPPRAGICVVGDFNPDTMLKAIERTFAQLPVHNAHHDLNQHSGVRNIVHEEQVVHIPEKANAVVWIGQYVSRVTREHPDCVAIQAGLNVLGGGMASRLFRRVREECGLSYHVQAGLSMSANTLPAHFEILCFTSPENIHEAQKEILAVIEQWHEEGITEQELCDERAKFLGGVAYQRTMFSNIGQEHVFEGILGKLNLMEERERLLNALTIGDVNRAIQKHFDPSALKIVRAGTVD